VVENKRPLICVVSVFESHHPSQIPLKFIVCGLPCIQDDMKLFREETVLVSYGFECDVCHRVDTNETTKGHLEMQEYLHYQDTCGYGAKYDKDIPFADGDSISISLCQYCKINILGAYFQVNK
jgi:hypothetical protein